MVDHHIGAVRIGESGDSMWVWCGSHTQQGGSYSGRLRVVLSLGSEGLLGALSDSYDYVGDQGEDKED